MGVAIISLFKTMFFAIIINGISGTNLSDFKVIDPWNGTIKSLSAFTLFGDNQIITYE